MKPWRDCTDAERIERLRDQLVIAQSRIERLTEHLGSEDIPGYTKLMVRMTMEGQDDYLGTFGGQLTAKEVA
jgi:hypothetical protein